MATYMELKALYNNSDLQDKTEIACIVAAENIRVDASPPANQAARLAWAVAVYRNPKAAGAQMLIALLAANKELDVGNAQTPDTILGATDSQIQAKVDAAVDLFADGS